MIPKQRTTTVNTTAQTVTPPTGTPCRPRSQKRSAVQGGWGGDRNLHDGGTKNRFLSANLILKHTFTEVHALQFEPNISYIQRFIYYNPEVAVEVLPQQTDRRSVQRSKIKHELWMSLLAEKDTLNGSVIL